MDDVQARTVEILLSIGLELDDRVVCEVLIFLKTFIREVDRVPNPPMINIGKTVAPLTGPDMWPLFATMRGCSSRARQKYREICLKVPI